MRKVIAICCALALAGCATLADGSAKRGSAKNVILFVGDGMGVSTVTAARIYVGQKLGLSGEEHVLPFEKFPHLALIKTYNSNQQVPDSAGTATAIHTGKKTRAGVIGIGPAAERGDCVASQSAGLATLGEIALERGKAVGIVTTTRLTHATPATVYAHTPERGWESDSKIPEAMRAKGCTDIALQLVEFGFDTALGGGKAYFLGSGHSGGKRIDPGADLLRQWRDATGGSVARTARDLDSADPDAPLLGVFADDHLPFMQQRQTPETPTLTQMTEAAIQRLSRRKGGYYLLVEGGRIDHAHHLNRAGRALAEAEEFARAVAKAVEMTSSEDTLILVTADHSHVFTFAGYPTRGNPILGLVVGNDARGNAKEKPELAQDGQSYTSLGYANGQSAVTPVDGARPPRPAPKTGMDAAQQALVPLPFETHGGEDVALYARGPGAHLVGGVMEQNLIFDVMTSAFGWSELSSFRSDLSERDRSARLRRNCRLALAMRGPPNSYLWPRNYHAGYGWYPPYSSPFWRYHTRLASRDWPGRNCRLLLR